MYNNHSGNLFSKRGLSALLSLPTAGLLGLMLLTAMLFASCGNGDGASGKEASTKSPEEASAEASESAERSSQEQPEQYDIAVFIPGAVAGSPLYRELAEGTEAAAGEYDYATAKVIEGGFNQGEWLDKVTELAASGKYELIVSSNPALPEICAKVADRFPEQKFLLFDGYLEGNEQIYTFRYNQREQAFLAGHMAGLITTAASSGGSASPGETGSPEGANEELKIGLIAGQEYPDMNNAIRPGYLQGARKINKNIELDFRVVGNWYDAAKAGELAKEMIAGGVDVILPIAGGANQGVLKAAKEHSAYLVWYDSNGYDKAPGVVLGSTAILQEEAAYKKTMEAIEGKIPFDNARVVGVEEGWITFLDEDPLFLEHVPEDIRKRQSELLKSMESGELSLPLEVESE